MNLLTLLYILCLFVIFTPGIFFSLGKKNSIKTVIVHGLLFTLVVYLSLRFILDKKIIEGNTESHTFVFGGNLDDALNSASVQNDGNNSFGSNGDSNGNNNNQDGSNCASGCQLMSEIQDIKNTISQNHQSDSTYFQQLFEANNFNPAGTDFTCTHKVPGSEFSWGELEGNSSVNISSPGSDGWNTTTSYIIATMGGSLKFSAASGDTDNIVNENSPQFAVLQRGNLQTGNDISKNISLKPGKYKVLVYANGNNRAESGSPNFAPPLTVRLNEQTQQISNIELNTWKQYETNEFQIQTQGEFTLKFSNPGYYGATNAVNDIGIKNIVIERLNQ